MRTHRLTNAVPFGAGAALAFADDRHGALRPSPLPSSRSRCAMSRLLTTTELIRALSLRALTDPAAGPHAMQVLLAENHAALFCLVCLFCVSPIDSIADTYDRRGYF